jgi:hypothetical protein
MTGATPADRAWLVAFYVGLATVTGAVSFFSRPLPVTTAAELQRQVWTRFPHAGAAAETSDHVLKVNSPRILVPALIAAVDAIPGVTWEKAFAAVRLFSIVAAYLVFHFYLREWFAAPVAILGTLVMAASVPLTFNNHFELPTEFPEIVAYTLGLWLIFKRRDTWLCGLILVATLNRETTLFLPLILLFCRYGDVHWGALGCRVGCAALCWLLPMVALREWTGIGWLGAHASSWPHNSAGLSRLMANPHPYNNYLFYLYLYGILWVLPFVRWDRQPRFQQRALLSVPAFLVVYLFFGGFMDEPREIVNLYPLLIPAGLFAVGWDRTSEGSRSAA